MPDSSATPLVQKNLHQWVHDILEEKGGRIMPDGTISIGGFHRSHFSDESIDRKVLGKLYEGHHVHENSVKTFADKLQLEPAIRTELLIRWGEAMLGRYAYEALPEQRDEFEKKYRCDKISFLSQIVPREHTAKTQKNYRDGFNRYLESHGKSVRDLLSLRLNTVYEFLRSGDLGAAGYLKLLGELPPKRPSKLGKGKIAYARQNATLCKLLAHYIEARLQVNLLELDYSTLKIGKDLFYYERLIDWLIVNCAPIKIIAGTPILGFYLNDGSSVIGGPLNAAESVINGAIPSVNILMFWRCGY